MLDTRTETTIYWNLLMEQVKEINIKNKSCYFCVDMVDVKHFQSNLSKIDKKSHEDIDIYYISYIIIKKFSDYENTHSVNPLYWIIHSATGHFKEKYGEKYLIIDSTEEYEKVWSEIKSEIKNLMVEKDCFMKKLIQELELIQMMIYL